MPCARHACRACRCTSTAATCLLLRAAKQNGAGHVSCVHISSCHCEPTAVLAGAFAHTLAYLFVTHTHTPHPPLRRIHAALRRQRRRPLHAEAPLRLRATLRLRCWATGSLHNSVPSRQPTAAPQGCPAHRLTAECRAALSTRSGGTPESSGPSRATRWVGGCDRACWVGMLGQRGWQLVHPTAHHGAVDIHTLLR